MQGVTRSPLVFGAFAFLAAFALRLPFASDYLWAWDSVLYAQALEGFDVASGRPHPPGYLFYVLAARVATVLTGEANSGLVLVSITAGAASAAVGFLIAARLFGSAVGVLTAVILMADPILWHYSELAYPYTLLALLSGTVGGLVWWSRRGHWARPLAASLAFALAAGFRQDIVLVLGPLWLWAVVPRGWRATTGSLVVLIVGCLTWLIPTALLSGGLERYLAVTLSQAVGVSTLGPSALQGMRDNFLMIAVGLRWQLHWALVFAPLGLWVLVRRRDLRRMVLPLALWTMPALIAYLVLHIGEWAYTLSVVVPLAMLTAVGATAILEVARPRVTRLAVVAAIVAALVLNAHSFVLGDGRFAARAIEGHDAGLATRFAAYRARFPASETVLVAEGGFQHARYYLPEYRVFYVPPGIQVTRRTLPVGPEVRNAMLFLGEIRAGPRTPVRMFAVDGVEIHYIPLERHSRVVIQDRLVFIEPE